MITAKINAQAIVGICLYLFLLAGCSSRARNVEQVLIKGSDTEVNLALALSETYMNRDSNISIAVTGGGSGMGIAALINGKTSIANSSRPFRPEELVLARERGIHPLPIVFAVDALALIVNEQLNVDSLSFDQLQAVFSGEIRNWRALGGPDRTITLYGRQSNSGTYVFFRDSILQREYTPELKQLNGNAQIVEGIRNDPAGIGYVGVGYILKEEEQAISGLKVLRVQGEGEERAFSPLQMENVLENHYPIIRPLYQYTDGRPQGKLEDFIRFTLSEEGQRIVAENGYYPIQADYRERNRKVLN